MARALVLASSLIFLPIQAQPRLAGTRHQSYIRIATGEPVVQAAKTLKLLVLLILYAFELFSQFRIGKGAQSLAFHIRFEVPAHRGITQHHHEVLVLPLPAIIDIIQQSLFHTSHASSLHYAFSNVSASNFPACSSPTSVCSFSCHLPMRSILLVIN